MTDADPLDGVIRNDPVKYFTKVDGQRTFLVAKLADEIMEAVTLAEGIDDYVWRYGGGVWRPDKHVVRDVGVRLLGDLYRGSHVRNAEDVVRARLRKADHVIDCEPVEQYINFANGLLDWRTGQLHDHTPMVRSTVQLATRWNPDATCPNFDKFLSEVLAPDDIPRMWELIGYLLYNGNPLHKAVMLVGTGRNGKGTWLRAMTALLGGRNITNISLHDLINTRFTTVALFGKLANFSGDIDGKYLESTATLKAITGEDRISAEHKHHDRFDFRPWALPVFSANKVPGSADVTTGYLSRWLVVGFPNSFEGREDRELDERLAAEIDGIAAAAVPALRRLMERGEFVVTPAGKEATEDFRRHVDQVSTWVDWCCELWPPHEFVRRSSLYTAYRRWARRDGYGAVRAGEFYDRLTALGAEPVTIKGVRGYRGIKVTDQAHEGDRLFGG